MDPHWKYTLIKQGRNFEIEVFKETCRLLNVVKTRTSPYHPSSNGIIERFNATLVTMIRSYVDENQRNCDQHIHLLTAAYRSTVHPAAGNTPNKSSIGNSGSGTPRLGAFFTLLRAPALFLAMGVLAHL